MKKNKLNIFVIILVLELLLSFTTALAHSGRTDAYGGHWDNRTGTYHFHTVTSSEKLIDDTLSQMRSNTQKARETSKISENLPKAREPIKIPEAEGLDEKLSRAADIIEQKNTVGSSSIPYTPSSEQASTVPRGTQNTADNTENTLIGETNMTEPTVTDMIVALIPPVIILLIILTVLAINKYLAKKRNAQRTKRKFWDKYNKTDINVPMAYFHFYITVRPIYSILYLLSSISETGISNIDFYTLSIQILELLTYSCACIGLAKRKYWGYKINQIFLIVEIIGCSLLFILLVSLQEYVTVPSLFIGMIVNSLSFVYFYKRKCFFTNASNDIFVEAECADETEILFRHNCSNCGANFKIRYRVPHNKTVAAKISVVCPNCKEKEIIATSEIFSNKDTSFSNEIPKETENSFKTSPPKTKGASVTTNRPKYKMKWKGRMLNISMIPLSIELNKDTLLPQTINRKYGFGKRFNTFVVTDNQNFYHRGNCLLVRGKKKCLLHRYIAIQNTSPCPYCRPNNKIDEWYLGFVKTNFGTDINYNEAIKNNELT